MIVKCYKMGEAELWSLVVATSLRNWMEQQQRFAYRCLPMKVANEQGWFILCPTDIELIWNGGPDPSDLQVVLADNTYCGSIKSHFGQGILTFSPPWFFRTEAPVGLRIAGPANLMVPGLFALEGLVETWTHNSTWTMNWRVQDLNKTLMLPKGTPICHITLHNFESSSGPELVVADYEDLPDEQRNDLNAWSAHRKKQIESKEPLDSLHYTRNIDSSGTKHKCPHWVRTSAISNVTPLPAIKR